jgi:uncharacterized protein YndB with AHSA1/START domain
MFHRTDEFRAAAPFQLRRDQDARRKGDTTMPSESATGTRDLVVTRVFDAPVEQVWRAWSDPECVKQWWGPVGFTVPVADIDFREGGRSLVCMSSPQFGDLYNTWRYRRIVPQERIEFILNFTDEAGTALDPQTVGIPPGVPKDVPHVVTFRSLGATTTEMTVTERGYTTDAAVETSRLGLEQVLDKMATIFAATT